MDKRANIGGVFRNKVSTYLLVQDYLKLRTSVRKGSSTVQVQLQATVALVL